MSTNWIRYLNLTASGAGLSAEFSQLRCRFNVRQFMTETPNIAEIAITNPAPNTIKAFLSQEFTKISIEAGYQDNHGIVFVGEIAQARYGRENPTDTWILVTARDSDRSYNFATVSKSFPAGSTPHDHFQAAMTSMQAMGAKPGYLGVDLSKPVFPRAVTLYGMARDVMRNIAVSKSATWSAQNGEIQMLGLSQTLPGSAIAVNSQTGLIGMPEQRLTGIAARVLINPAIKVHTMVQINQGDIQRAKFVVNYGGTADMRNAALPSVTADGHYKVLQISVEGDTRDTPWYMDLLCVAVSSSGKVVGRLPANLAMYEGTE